MVLILFMDMNLSIVTATIVMMIIQVMIIGLAALVILLIIHHHQVTIISNDHHKIRQLNFTKIILPKLFYQNYFNKKF